MIKIPQRNKTSEMFQDIFHFPLKSVSEVIGYDRPTVNDYTKENEYTFYLEGEFEGEHTSRTYTLISLDIIAFEEKMKEKGYKEGALKEFVESKYGKEASVLIDKLL